MKLMKKLVVLVAAMTMAFGLVACGGETWPKEYKISEARGEGEQAMSLTLEEDGTYAWNFYATESNGSGNVVMNVDMTGTYTIDGDTVTLVTAEGEGYYVAGASQTPFTFTMDEPGMYANTMAMGSFVFTVADDGTFAPVVE